MKKALFLAVAAAAGIVSCAETSKPVQNHQLQPVKKGRGFATAKVERPAHFPHRIWAFSGFESRPDNFGWFGAAETKNILKYPGNTAARRGTPQKKWSALKTGMNPVPGPRMGKLNKLYIRYYLKGTDTVRFQHYSLSSGDNCNILVSGLEQGRWAETVLNFTRDSRRNDGSPGAFKEGERMDDLQVYVGKPADGKQYEIIIDDAILFAEAPGAPPADEPFPSPVVFLAAAGRGQQGGFAEFHRRRQRPEGPAVCGRGGALRRRQSGEAVSSSRGLAERPSWPARSRFSFRTYSA